MRVLRIIGFLFGFMLLGVCGLFGVGREGISTASQIVFVRQGADVADNLYIMDADWGRLRQLTDFEGGEFQPTLSPDGAWVAFITEDDTQVRDRFRHLYKIRTDGSDLTFLADVSPNQGSPEWSPSGEWIAYTTNQGIYRLRPDGRDSQRVTPPEISASWPSWSPDSEWILFQSNGGEAQLYRIRADGTDLEPIIFEVENLNNSEWSPDGQRVAFTTSTQLYVLELNGLRVHQLTFEGWIKSVPTWSPDGEWILYATFGNSSFDLYKIRVDGTEQQKFVEFETADKQPEWGQAIDMAWSGWWMVLGGLGIGVIGTKVGRFALE